MKCGKVCFADEKFAQAYIDKLQRTSNRKLKPVRAYLCEKCFNWHLTSIEGTEVRQKIEHERQISNLKSKILHLQNENQILKSKIEKWSHKNV